MRYLTTICALACLVGTAAAGTKPEDVVAKNLDSIGAPDARAAVKSRSVQGTLRFKSVVGGRIDATGAWQEVSEQHKSNFLMKFDAINWRGERFVTDGDKTSIASATAGYHRSTLAEFVNSYSFIVSDGLLGGELSTNWALQDLDRHKCKLENIGVKKVDGRELQGLEYLSKNNNEMKVRLYFDPETGRHVMTVYEVAQGAIIAHTDKETARQKDVRYILEERFSDFQTEGGMTLPRAYDLRFSQELQNGSTSLYDWSMTAEKLVNNISLDPKNFELK
ncbi:MAG: hypothetical protein ABR874_21475 [Candidatus Sulfotelmatobacter sp.]